MKRIISFAGMVVAAIVLIATMVKEPEALDKGLIIGGNALALCSFIFWVRGKK
jgi:hypothetical protein